MRHNIIAKSMLVFAFLLAPTAASAQGGSMADLYQSVTETQVVAKAADELSVEELAGLSTAAGSTQYKNGKLSYVTNVVIGADGATHVAASNYDKPKDKAQPMNASQPQETIFTSNSVYVDNTNSDRPSVVVKNNNQVTIATTDSTGLVSAAPPALEINNIN